MRIGVFVGASVADMMTLDGLLARIKQAEDDGFDSFWIPHISARGYDALTTLALAGMQTSRIELGVGVVPTYPRHPAALAQQALTTATATKGRFILGIGPSHRPGMEEGLRHPLRPPRPAHPRVPSGDAPLFWKRVRCSSTASSSTSTSSWPPLNVRHAPSSSQPSRPRCSTSPGSSPTAPSPGWPGPAPLRPHITPRIRRSAENSGRSAPRVCVGLPTAITDDENAGRRKAAESYARYGELVNYRRVLDIEGVESPAEVAVIGNEASLQRQMETFAEGGATDFVANIFDIPGEPESSQRAYDALKSLVGKI